MKARFPRVVHAGRLPGLLSHSLRGQAVPQAVAARRRPRPGCGPPRQRTSVRRRPRSSWLTRGLTPVVGRRPVWRCRLALGSVPGGGERCSWIRWPRPSVNMTPVSTCFAPSPEVGGRLGPTTTVQAQEKRKASSVNGADASLGFRLSTRPWTSRKRTTAATSTRSGHRSRGRGGRGGGGGVGGVGGGGGGSVVGAGAGAGGGGPPGGDAGWLGPGSEAAGGDRGDVSRTGRSWVGAGGASRESKSPGTGTFTAALNGRSRGSALSSTPTESSGSSARAWAEAAAASGNTNAPNTSTPIDHGLTR